MKNLYLEIGIDKTTSMKHIYPAVYRFLGQSFELLGESAGKSGSRIHYGLTFVRPGTAKDPSGCEKVTFKNGQLFTDNVKEVLDRLRGLVLSGGDPSGYEPWIIPAIQKMLEKLREAGDPNEEEDSRGLLFFSDSLPSEKECFKEYERIDRLRFAHFFLYDDSRFVPFIQISNRQNHAVDGAAAVRVYGIDAILKSGLGKEKAQELLGVVEHTSFNL